LGVVVFFSLTFPQDEINILEVYKQRGGGFNVGNIYVFITKRKQTHILPLFGRGYSYFFGGSVFGGYLFRPFDFKFSFILSFSSIGSVFKKTGLGTEL